MSETHPAHGLTGKARARLKRVVPEAIVRFRATLDAPMLTGQPVIDLEAVSERLADAAFAAATVAGAQAHSKNAVAPEEFLMAARSFYEPALDAAIAQVRKAARTQGRDVSAEVREVLSDLLSAVDALWAVWGMGVLELHRKGCHPRPSRHASRRYCASCARHWWRQ